MQEYEQLQKFLERGNYTREEKIAIIKEFGKLYEQKINKEFTDYRNKQIAAGLFEVGSAAIPGAGIGGSAVKAGAGQFLQKSLGRKLAQKVTQSAIDGAAEGSIFGFGRGLAEDKNPLYTAATDAVFGLGTGAIAGGITGNIEKNSIKKELLSKPKQTKLSNEYYTNYERGINPVRKDLGEIKLISDGFKETNRQQPQYTDKVIDLSKNLKKAEYLNTEAPQHSHKFDITKFHRLGGDGVDYLIAENAKGNKYFHKVTSPNLAGPEPEGQDLSFIRINDIAKKVNLDKWLDIGTTPVGLAIKTNLLNTKENPSIPLNSHNNTPQNGVLETGISYNEFNPNARQNQQNHDDYSNYRNPLSGDNKIYTREDIGDMPNEEFTDKEAEIRSQWGKIGIPSNAQMNSAGGAVYIAPYTRSDGTHVRGHYRAR